MANEFKSISDNLYRKTRRRVLWELVISAVLTAIVWSGWPGELPLWIKWSVPIVCVAYIVIGVALYPSAKASAQTFAIKLLDNELSFSSRGNSGRLPYTDLKISKVKRKNGKVVEIHLRTVFRQTIKLHDLENMQELHESLVKRVGAS